MKVQANFLIKLTLLCITTTLLIHTESTQPPFACDTSNPSTKTYPFCKTTLPISQRAKDLVARLTLDEKVSQLVNTASAIPRLGIPAYQWWSEALHGVSNSGFGINFNGRIKVATSFPQVILTAASFDVNLWYRIGQAIGLEARAVYNEGQAQGMTFWAPNINVFRDPRWGRGQETPGEDPLVTGKYAVSYVRGIQGDSFEGGKLRDGHLQASACCKHFTAYDLDNWKGINRYGYDAKVSKQDLADTYQPPFQSCIEKAGASGIMCAYNRVNGVPNCADYNLLTNIARGQWKFQGYITSDCDAVSIIHDVQGYAKEPEDAIADVLKAGMDVNCGSYLKNYTKSAVQKNKVPESQVDRALRNLFAIRMRLGLFNGNPNALPYGQIGSNQVCTKAHQDLALEAARNGIVLLKNSAKILPLPKNKPISLAVIGPNANSARTLLGNYAGPPCQALTPLQAGKQQSLVDSVARASKKPVVLVVLSGGPVDISFAKYNRKIGGILWAGYPGEAGGVAISEILFGDHNPGGKLPVTWYPKEFIKVPMTNMQMRPQPRTGYPGRTYRFYTGKKVYSFGFGLSYSKYLYEFVSVTQSKLHLSQLTSTASVKTSDSGQYISISEMGTDFCEKAKFSATVGVNNHGEMAGKHPVLLFIKQNRAKIGSPIKQLAAFQSISLNAGERAEIEFVLNPCEHLGRANEDGLMVIEEGSHYLIVGDKEYPISVLP